MQKIYYQFDSDLSCFVWFHPAVGFCESTSLTSVFAECALEFGSEFELIECLTDFCDLRDRGLIDASVCL